MNTRIIIIEQIINYLLNITTAMLFYNYQRLLWLPTIIELFQTHYETNLNSQVPETIFRKLGGTAVLN